MTNFVKSNFDSNSEYVQYKVGDKYEFVARFKYAKSSKGPFINFLIKNFTVEEYFGRITKGEAPLKILESKGFLLSHIKKLLKEGGYEVSQRGYKQMLQDKVFV